ncbi:MAG: RagB/SusD family nutrient uptake outer membrane protein [Cytophagaceae bacterium]|nr:RagB/SusD family nutrient uptake outer membrane protein [Cytophagaceae bacterium]
MKKTLYGLGIALAVGTGLVACKDSFLMQLPQGALSENALQNEKGVYAALIGAYSMLDGWAADWTHGDVWRSAGSNWVWGNVVADDAYKGTDIGDQSDLNPIERWEVVPTNPYLGGKWGNVYAGVARANSVLDLMAKTTGLPAEKIKSFTAEARFLRGHYHFEVKKVFNNVPYIDQKAVEVAYKVANDKDIWPNIIEDLKFAGDNLPETHAEVGRINKWGAKAMLAKAYMYQNKYSDALPLINELITSGKTTNGKKYALNDCFYDNFNAATKNSAESVLAIQQSVNDGDNDGNNGGYGEVLNYPYQGGPGACCGFHQPSQNLVNAFKVDSKGLPLFGTFNQSDLKSDQGVATSDSIYLPDTTTPVDPRLDWTTGRRGIPYLDWGPHPGAAWIRDQSYGGPYSPKKNVFAKSQQGTLSTGSGWAQGNNANNYTLIRFADVLLWAAECEIEIGSLEKARAYINQIRKRAGSCMVMGRLTGYGAKRIPIVDLTKPAANYLVKEYPGSDASFASKEKAREALRFERRLELAMEGHRFFDLVRWGVAAEVLNEYVAVESRKRQYKQGARFTKGKNEYMPIPQVQIINSSINGKPTLKQNPGY